MKFSFKYLFFILIFAFTACDKDERFENSLNGTWELRYLKGGQIANVPPDYPPGNGSIFKVEGNTYQRLNKGSVVFSGTFTIIKDENKIDGTKFSYKLDFDNTMQLDVFAEMAGKKLILSSGSMASDGSTSTYEKL